MKKEANHKKPKRTAVKHTAAFLAKQRAGKELYLKHLAQSFGREIFSAQQANLSYWTVREWRERDLKFNDRVIKTLEIVPTAARDEAIRRGIHGFEGRPVTFEGKIVREMTEYSDKMLSSILAAHDPAYRAKGDDEEPKKVIVEIQNFARNSDKAAA